MFRYQSIQDSTFGSLFLTAGDRALCAVLEGCRREPEEGRALSRLLADAVAALPSFERGATETIAHTIDGALRKRGPDSDPGWAFFAGFLVIPGAVEVCTAGILRVSLAAGGVVVASTRDHIVRDDPPGDSLGDDIDPLLMATVPTRSLGGSAGGPPEVVVWHRQSPIRIVTCSFEWHAHGGRSDVPGIVDDLPHELRGFASVVDVGESE